jgi:hypothetical protein
VTRILITGSRDWADRESMRAALFQQLTKLRPESGRAAVLIHGGCRGADSMAAAIWRSWGLSIEQHDADWAADGKAAGPIRNQRMVNLGADICLAFPTAGSRGTYDCVRRAREAGIPTEIIEAAKEVNHG